MGLNGIMANSDFSYSLLEFNYLTSFQFNREAQALLQLDTTRKAFTKYIENPTDEKIAAFMQDFKYMHFSARVEEEIWSLYLRYVAAIEVYSNYVEGKSQNANTLDTQWTIFQFFLATVTRIRFYLTGITPVTLLQKRQEYLTSLERLQAQEEKAVNLFMRYFKLENPLQSVEEINYFFHLMAFADNSNLVDKIFEQKHKYLAALQGEGIHLDVLFKQELHLPSPDVIKLEKQPHLIQPEVSVTLSTEREDNSYLTDSEEEYFSCEEEEVSEIPGASQSARASQDLQPPILEPSLSSQNSKENINLVAVLEGLLHPVLLKDMNLVSVISKALFPQDKLASIEFIGQQDGQLVVQLTFKQQVIRTATQVGEGGWQDVKNARFVIQESMTIRVDYEKQAILFEEGELQVGLFINDFEPYLKRCPWYIQKGIEAALHFSNYFENGLEATFNLKEIRALESEDKVRFYLSVNGEHTVIPQKRGQVINQTLLDRAKGQMLFQDLTPQELVATFEHFSS